MNFDLNSLTDRAQQSLAAAVQLAKDHANAQGMFWDASNLNLNRI